MEWHLGSNYVDSTSYSSLVLDRNNFELQSPGSCDTLQCYLQDVQFMYYIWKDNSPK